MMNVRNIAAALALGLAVAAGAAPAMAQTYAAGSAAAARAQAVPDDFDGAVSGARAAALRDCSAQAAPYQQDTWGDTQEDHYRACMAEHGQAE